MRQLAVCIGVTFLVVGLMWSPGNAFQNEGTVRIGQMEIMTGIFAFFGKERANNGITFVLEEINAQGGVLVDGKRVKLVRNFGRDAYDSGCTKPEEAIALLRKMTFQDKALMVVGPSCSTNAEPVFGTLQKKLGDPKDIGLQIPVISIISLKPDITGQSPWAFRNTPRELAMYDWSFGLLKKEFGVNTIAVGYEEDFAHSIGTAKKAFVKAAEKHGMTIKRMEGWLVDDTDFSVQIRKLKRTKADMFANAGHPLSQGRSQIEAGKRGWKPKIRLALDCALTPDTVDVAGAKVTEGLIGPTSFWPEPGKAEEVADRFYKRFGYGMDLHSASAYETMYMVKWAIEHSGIKNRPDTLEEDRRKFRDVYAGMKNFPGLNGPITVREDGDVDKGFYLVQFREGKLRLFAKPGVGLIN